MLRLVGSRVTVSVFSRSTVEKTTSFVEKPSCAGAAQLTGFVH